MGYIETSTSWDYVGMTIYPLDEQGQRLTKKVGQDTVEISYYLPDFGLYRVSNSNRYNDILVPTIKSTTVEVPGGDGMYWFGSQHTQKPFTIKFAYDNLEESNLHTLRRLFNGKNRLQIIFDEYPYKFYDVVVSQAPQFDYVPYTEDRVMNGVETPRRIFKGEGSVQLTSYLPYAVGVNGVKRWSATDASGEPTDPLQKTWANWHELYKTVNYYNGSNAIDTYMTFMNKKLIFVWNAGDMPTDFKLTVDAATLNAVTNIDFKEFFTNTTIASFQKSVPADFSFTESVTFDSRLHLIYGVSGTIYNRYFSTEAFVTIPVSQSGYINYFDFVGTDLPESGPEIEYFYRFY